MMKLAFLLSIFLKLIINQSTLTTADFTSSVISSRFAVESNPLGISMDFPQLLPNIDSNLFQQYLLNSNAYGNWDANFEQYVHVPVGYKFNCSLVAELSPNETVDCKMELNNTNFITSLSNYIWNTTIDYAFSFGWDIQSSLFSSSNYTKNSFLAFFFNIYNTHYQMFNMQLADKANLYEEMGIKTSYKLNNYIQDCNSINNYVYGMNIVGPGVTATADQSWYQKMGDVYYYCGFFTVRGVVFDNSSSLTIDNLLSDEYTTDFLIKRFNVNGFSFLNDVASFVVVINDLRLTEDALTIDGITNSFAAAIWAIDISLEWFFMSGYRLDFYNSFKNTHQTLLGQGPEFQPTNLYSALLFINSALLNYPKIHKGLVTAGTSSSIKVFGLRYLSTSTYGVIILNKDRSPSANGIVRVAISQRSGITCSYLSAPSLEATSGSTISGVSFVSNSSKPIGQFKNIDYEIDGTGYYNIQVNYSQVVQCRSKVVNSYKYFPTGRGASEIYIALSLLLLLFF